MRLTLGELDEIFANAERLKARECLLACAACGRDLPYRDGPNTCGECGACHLVFRSCTDACDAIVALQSMKQESVAPTSYVPRLGWVVGFAA